MGRGSGLYHPSRYFNWSLEYQAMSATRFKCGVDLEALPEIREVGMLVDPAGSYVLHEHYLAACNDILAMLERRTQ
jgi:hypothetical protein